MKNWLLSVILLLALGACIDAEVEMDFSDGKNMNGNATISFSRQLFDLMENTAAEACPGGNGTLTQNLFVCKTSGTGSIEELLAGEWSFEGGTEVDPASSARFTRLDENRIKIVFDFTDMLNNREMSENPEALDGMEDMIKAALAGHSFVFRIKAYKIEETTGTLSEDGTQAQMVIPVGLLLDEDADLGPPFETIIQLEPKCFLGVFCD